MFERYKRTNFLTEMEISNGSKEWDFLQNNWDLFELNSPIRYDSVKIIDNARPDALSFRLYGTVEYWWILCKINAIDDMWNDMEIGTQIIVPDVQDIEQFYKRVRRRLRT